MLKVFSAGADAQAYNLLSAQLTAARALAITEGQYAGVHVQLAAANSRQAGNCYLSVVQYVDINIDNGDEPVWQFQIADGFTPRRAPGGFAFGQLNPLNDGTIIIFPPTDPDKPNEFNPAALDDTSGPPSNLDDFTTFTILFSPSGDLSKTVDGEPIYFNVTTNMNATELGVFDNDTDPGAATYLWNPNAANFPGGAGEGSATAVTMFNYGEFSEITGASDRANYLNGDRQFIAVNVYTGQLFRRE